MRDGKDLTHHRDGLVMALCVNEALSRSKESVEKQKLKNYAFLCVTFVCYVNAWYCVGCQKLPTK